MYFVLYVLSRRLKLVPSFMNLILKVCEIKKKETRKLPVEKDHIAQFFVKHASKENGFNKLSYFY